MAAFLLVGNLLWWHFDPHQPLWRRLGKVAVALTLTTAISHYVGHTGVATAVALTVLAILYVHGIVLPRKGIHGWTGKPLNRSDRRY